MRILFLCNVWAATREPARLVGQHLELSDGRHQWVRAVAGPAPAASDIQYDLRTHSVRDIARRFPGGWPDAMVVWAPGYMGLPSGIEDAPFPVVACYSDWPLVMPNQAGMLGAYEYLFTDRGGVRTLQQMGYDNVEFWPLYSHDPTLSRVIPGVEKVWDIGMVGNMSSVVQRERAPWLARVARLADRYRVRIAGGVFNEEYTRLLNATKITFNYTFKIPLNRTFLGAMNMRCYEAAACGSLLFCDEDNEEIREFFEDRIHCVLYNDQNLEALLDYYLSHDEERERITAAAVERVGELSFPRSLRRLADRLEELDLPTRMKARRARSLAVPELRKRHARQAIGSMTLGAHDLTLRCLREVLEADPDDTAAHNDLAVDSAILPGFTGDWGLKRQFTVDALDHMRRAVELCPASAFYKLNLAHMYADTGWWEMALDLTQQALALLESGHDDPADPFCLAFPFGWNEYRVQLSILYNATRSAPESFPALWRCLLFHRAGMLLGQLAEEHGLPHLALLGYRVASAARPDLGSGRVALGRVLATGIEGQSPGEAVLEEAGMHLKAGLQTDPFVTEGWTIYVEVLQRLGRHQEAQAFVAEHLTMLETLSPPRERRAMSEALSDLEEVRQALTRLREPGAAAA